MVVGWRVGVGCGTEWCVVVCNGGGGGKQRDTAVDRTVVEGGICSGGVRVGTEGQILVRRCEGSKKW